jgi:hypothetical protein
MRSSKIPKYFLIKFVLVAITRFTVFYQMKHIFILLVLAGILFQNFSKVIILTQFGLNRSFIAANLCVKKNEPGNCCKGKCQLKKQLTEDEKSGQNRSGNFKGAQEFQLFCQQTPQLSLISFYKKVPVNFRYQLQEPSSLSTSIYHPPKS